MLRPQSPLNALLTTCVLHARQVGGQCFTMACMLITDIMQLDPPAHGAVARSELGNALLFDFLKDLPSLIPLVRRSDAPPPA
jgi:hypothetical protein